MGLGSVRVSPHANPNSRAGIKPVQVGNLQTAKIAAYARAGRPSDAVNLRLGTAGEKLIKQGEGLSLRAYQDSVGVWTIGWGHTGNVKPGQTITKAQAEQLFRQDMRESENIVAKYAKVPLSQNQYDALVSAAFNLGDALFVNRDGSTTGLNRALNGGHYDEVPDQLRRFVNGGGHRIEGLVNRREAEIRVWNGHDSQAVTGGGGTSGGSSSPVKTPPANDGLNQAANQAQHILRRGSEGQSVRNLQRELNQQGANLTVDGLFGAKTQAALESFQRRHDLTPDGIFGPESRQALQSQANLVREGDQGSQVKTIQEALNKHGAGLTADGIFGPKTQATVESFQQRHGLTSDGIVGPQTRAALGQRGGSAPKTPSRPETPKAPTSQPNSGPVNQVAAQKAKSQMSKILDYARAHVPGGVGYCYGAVTDYLMATGYGNIKPGQFRSFMGAEHLGYARNFAEFMNAGNNAERAGLVRLPIDNPYDAPAGAIVVVAAGSPGTSYRASNHYAGDISIATGDGHFINDHPTESYGGSAANFRNGVGASNPGHPGKVLGIYVPKGFVAHGKQY